MKKRVYWWIGLGTGAAYILWRGLQPRRFCPGELYNILWDPVAGRWRTDQEVIDYLKEHPERVPEPLTQTESQVLKYIPEIEAAARAFLISEGLIAGIIAVESEGLANARGLVGEYGLMQVRGSTAAWLGYEGNWDDLFDPGINIYYGTKYLRHQFDRYGDQPETAQYAIAAYNAGTAYYSKGKFKNQNYVDKVIVRWGRYEVLINRCKGVYGPIQNR